MFTFHGWAVVRLKTSTSASLDERECDREVERKLSQDFRERFAGDDYCQWQLTPQNNLMFCGQHNHRDDRFLQIFRWLAHHAPGSYGLLYAWDPEGFEIEENGSIRYADNEYRVFRLCRGEIKEFDDSLLSPCYPTVEDGLEKAP